MPWLRPILFALAASLSAVVFAAPPQLTQQVPGFYRQQVGKFIITALYDGYVKLDTQWLKGVSANDLQSLVARMFQTTDNGGIQTAVNAFLVHTGERLLLFDAGAAKCFGP
ncbi:MAG TPA: MBL fold metallo-hydrolase, partial [Accumulibacter sp.]|nr:MBL fold metallo-hydrolase [Accumulibacter sp.]